MKLNEALLIGGALLATLVLSKGGAASSNVKPFSGKSAVPVLPIEDKTPIFQTPILQIPQTISQITKIIITPPKVTQIDITDQLKNIFNIETEKKDQRISYLQDELDQTRSYITTEQGTAQVDQYNENLPYDKYRSKKAYLYQSDREALARKYGEAVKFTGYTDDKIINYYEDLIESESALGYGGSFTGGKFRKFPLITSALTNLYNTKIAKRNITKAEVYADQQQEGINLVEEEYQTRFGGLSRYG
jgi:hypothetical protein